MLAKASLRLHKVTAGPLGRGVGPFSLWGGLRLPTSKARNSEAPVVSGPWDWAEPGTVTGRHRRRSTDRDLDTEPQRERETQTLRETWAQTYSEARRETGRERRRLSKVGASRVQGRQGRGGAVLLLRPHSVLRWGPKEGLPGVCATRLGVHWSEDGRSFTLQVPDWGPWPLARLSDPKLVLMLPFSSCSGGSQWGGSLV